MSLKFVSLNQIFTRNSGRDFWDEITFSNTSGKTKDLSKITAVSKSASVEEIETYPLKTIKIKKGDINPYLLSEKFLKVFPEETAIFTLDIDSLSYIEMIDRSIAGITDNLSTQPINKLMATPFSNHSLSVTEIDGTNRVIDSSGNIMPKVFIETLGELGDIELIVKYYDRESGEIVSKTINVLDFDIEKYVKYNNKINMYFTFK